MQQGGRPARRAYVGTWPRSEDGKKGGDEGKTMATRAKAHGAMVPEAEPDAPPHDEATCLHMPCKAAGPREGGSDEFTSLRRRYVNVLR